MISKKELIFATKPYTAENKILSWWYSISTFSFCIILFCSALFLPFTLLRIVCAILLGMMNLRLFVLYHDHQHHAILYKSSIGDILFTIFGLYILAPVSIWDRSHTYHHNHNSKLFRPSVGAFHIMSKQVFNTLSAKEQKKYLLSRHPLTILFGYLTMFVWNFCIQPLKNSPGKHMDSLVAILLHITITILLIYFKGPQIYLLVWLMPLFIVHAMSTYLFYAQHNFPGVHFRNNKIEWSYENAALESSSYLKMNRIMRWFTANIGYHHIHHINSSIPFYRLPEAMEKIPGLKSPKVITLKVKDIAACLKLKLWDEEKKEMVGL